MVTTRGAIRRSMSPEKIATPKGPSASTRSTRHTSPSKSSRRSVSPTKPKTTPSKVRRKLEKTSIAPAENLLPIGENTHSEDGTDEAGSVKADEKDTTTEETNGARGRITRKRSFEEVAKEVEIEEEKIASKHSRKRSKEHVGGDEIRAEAGSEKDVVTNGSTESKAGADEDASISTAHAIVEKVVDMVNDPTLTPPPEAEDTGKGAISAAYEPPAVKNPHTTPTKTYEKAAGTTSSAQTSPKGKRNRAEYDEDYKVEVIETPTEPAQVADVEGKHDAATTEVATPLGGEPGSKRAREDVPDSIPTEAQPAEITGTPAEVCQYDLEHVCQTLMKQILATSGFSNTSAQSGFGMLAAPKPIEKSPLPETSSTAFASSGFASLAGSSSSGFGSLGAQASASPFGTMGNHNATSSFGSFGSFGQPAATATTSVADQAKLPVPASGFASLTSSASPFASVPGTSVFGGAPAAFDGAAYGGGFRGSFVSAPSSKPLSSFASASTAPNPFGSKPARAFGAADDDEEGADDDDDPEAGPAFAEDAEHKDDRFYEQSRMFICRHCIPTAALLIIK